MLPSARYSGTGGSNHLVFRDDPRGYRKKGKLAKQAYALLPVILGLITIGLVAGLVLLNNHVKHGKAEHAKLQRSFNERLEDAQRLQRSLNSERELTRRISRELADLRSGHSKLEEQAKKAGEQLLEVHESATEHQQLVDELHHQLHEKEVQLHEAEVHLHQEQEAAAHQHETDMRRLEALQLQSDSHHRLWGELNQRLRAATAQHALKEAEWNTLKADMEAQMAKEDASAAQQSTGGARAAAIPSPPPVAVRQQGGAAQGTRSSTPGAQGATGGGQGGTAGATGAVDPEIAHLVSLLGALGISKDGMEGTIGEFVRTQQAESAHPGMEQPAQGDFARRLAELMRDRGIVAPGAAYDFLLQTLANYFAQGTNLQHMVGRRELPGQGSAASGAEQQQQQQAAGEGSTASHAAGRKEIQDPQPQQGTPAVQNSAEQVPQQGAAQNNAKPADRWHAWRHRNREGQGQGQDVHRVKPDSAGFVA